MPPGKGRDRPIARTHARADIYENLSEELGVPPKEAKAIVVSVEDKGFLLREAVMLIYLAKGRADLQIKDGKFKKEEAAQALHESIDYLAKLVEDEGLGWITLTMRAGVKEDPRSLTLRANSAIGLSSQQAGVTRTPQRAEGGRQAGEARRPAEATRQRDRLSEKTLPREVVLKNLARELAVDAETAQRLLLKVESEMPQREAVVLILVADAVAGKKIASGEFSKEQRSQALERSVEDVLPLVRRGEGWGDVGRRMGVPMSGYALNKRANGIIGQK